MMRFKSFVPLSLALCLISTSLIVSCNKEDSLRTAASTDAAVTTLNCAGATIAGGIVSDMVYSGTATVPYTGGDGGTYAEGAAITSTGVTGLTATLQAGTLASGAGSLTYLIKGSASGTGTATFAINFGGQTCSIAVPVGTVTTGCSIAATPAARVACLAEAFKATLTTAQIATLQIALTKANAIKWSNLPGGVAIRNGLEFSTLNATQLAAAKAVIQAAAGTTANEGYDEFSQINAADDVLALTAGSAYSSGEYIIAFLGTPSATGTWMLQFGGHHYAQNITYSNGATVSGTPSHQGVEPKSWTSGTTTFAPLAQEVTAMQELLASMTAAELSTAKIATTFSDVLLGPNKDGQFPATKSGIKVGALSTAAQAKVVAAMLPWLNDLDSSVRASLLTLYTSQLADTYVTYSANNSGTSGNSASFFTSNTDYVRIDGPGVWIEFICQTGAVYRNEIHYHTIFRDHTRDYNGL